MPFCNLDVDILVGIQEHVRCTFLNYVFPLITHLGDAGIFWILLTAVLLCFKKTRMAACFSAGALVGSLLLNNLLLKPLVARVRPYKAHSEVILLKNAALPKLFQIKEATDFSFPSGHSAASFASSVAMCRSLPRKWAVTLIVVACLIAFSRLYIGIHYPSDVLAGILDGILLGILANIIGNAVLRRINRGKELSRADVKQKG